MKRWRNRIALVLAVGFLALTCVNASWLAPTPLGAPRLIAHRGAMQQYGRAEAEGADCTAAHIEPPLHNYLENTVNAINGAQRLGAGMIELNLMLTADHRIALFHDANLECRTNGHGLAAAATLAQLQALDAGYGYTADHGKTFPLRGIGRGQIPSLEQALAAVRDPALLYSLGGSDPALADTLIAVLKTAGRDPIAHGDGFSGSTAQIARIRAAWPEAWAYSPESIRACNGGYLKFGWFGRVPDECRNGTIAVPINYAWAYPGWPDRMIARMAQTHTRIVVIGPYQHDTKPKGLDLPEQLGDIPIEFNGLIWVDDIWTIGPALHPGFNKRTPLEEDELAKALAARRAQEH